MIRILPAMVNILLFLAASSYANAQNLHDVVQKTLETNPDVLAAEKRKSIEEYNYDQIRGRYMPSLDITGAAGREWSDNPITRGISADGVTLTRTELGVTLTQLLFDGFETKSALAGQESAIGTTTYQLQDVREVVGLRAIEVYIDVLRRMELLDLAKENLAKHEETLQKIKLRSESGAGRRVDQVQTEGRLALAKATVLAAEQNLDDARSSYQSVVGELPYDLIRPDPFSPLPGTLEQTLEQARNANPAILAAREEINTARAGREQARSSYYPRVQLEAGATRNNDLDGIEGINEDARMMVRMRYNLFNGGSDEARIASAGERVSEAMEKLAGIQRKVEEEVRLSWSALMNIRLRLKYLKAHRDHTEDVRGSYEKQFAIGQRSLLDLLDVETELFRAKSDYVSAEYVELFATYRILSSIGSLTKSLEL